MSSIVNIKLDMSKLKGDADDWMGHVVETAKMVVLDAASKGPRAGVAKQDCNSALAVFGGEMIVTTLTSFILAEERSEESSIEAYEVALKEMYETMKKLGRDTIKDLYDTSRLIHKGASLQEALDHADKKHVEKQLKPNIGRTLKGFDGGKDGH